MSKAIVEGTVEVVHAKEIPEDAYGNTFRVSVKMSDGNFYGFGTKKKGELNVKDGAGWHSVQKGDVIEFVAESRESNGRTFWNAKSNGVTVKSKGGGNSGAPSGGSSGGSRSAGGGGNAGGSYTNHGIAVGHAINNAVIILGKGATIPKIKQQAIEIYQLSMDMQEEAKKGLYDQAPLEEEKKQEQAQAAPEFDDDIPF